MATSLDEELQNEQDEREQELENLRQQQRFQQQQEEERVQQPPNRAVEAGKQIAKDFAKDQAKKLLKKSTWEAVWATSPYWGTALLVVVGIILILFVVVAVPVAVCNTSYGDGTGISEKFSLGAAKAAFSASGFCDMFQGGRSGGGGASGSFTNSPSDPLDLVSLVGLVNVDSQTSDPRVRQCMAIRVQNVFAQARGAGLSITITSAFRSGGTTAGGGTSAHSRGEAVDIALRPVPGANSDPRIDTLLAIAESQFGGAEADVLDEYRSPAENASAKHVHVEFNIPSPPTNSYCAPFPSS